MDLSGFRVGIVFSGGPAPVANSVIAATSSAFRRACATVIGFRSGYTHLQSDDELQEGEHYFRVEDHHLWGLRNNRGVFLGTGRANPALAIESQEDLRNEDKNHALVNVYHSLKNLDIHALISIGGDGTLKMANCLYEYQNSIAEKEQRIRIVHVPKTIDNNYAGIDFTFGFFTAVPRRRGIPRVLSGHRKTFLRALSVRTSKRPWPQTRCRKRKRLPIG